jgi:hypothetical protein
LGRRRENDLVAERAGQVTHVEALDHGLAVVDEVQAALQSRGFALGQDQQLQASAVDLVDLRQIDLDRLVGFERRDDFALEFGSRINSQLALDGQFVNGIFLGHAPNLSMDVTMAAWGARISARPAVDYLCPSTIVDREESGTLRRTRIQ